MEKPSQSLLNVIRGAAVIAAIAGVTFLDYRVIHVNSATAAFSFLLVILGLATRAGLRESILASFAGMLAYNFFFLPPIGALTIADPQNWVALFVFLATAITASQLSSSARRQAKEAAAREEELRCMYDFSRALMLGDDDRSLSVQITSKIHELFRFPDVWFYHRPMDSVTKIAALESPINESLLREVAITGHPWEDGQHSALVVPVQLGGHVLGSLGAAGKAAVSYVALKSIAQLAAIAIERAHAQEQANRMEATRQNEHLKSTLLDALAHEFKTPLTSIKAATTAVLARPKLDDTEKEFLTIVDEEADRLTNLVTEAIELARWSSRPVELHREPYPAAELIAAVTAQLRGLVEGREMRTSIPKELPMLNVDHKLTELALRQLLQNAVVYSPPGSAIRISAVLRDGAAVIHLANEGAGIPKWEQELIFDKFYRGRDVRNRVAGTGMGLSITRDIVSAHGGHIWVESAPDKGTTFSLTLPAMIEDPAAAEEEKQTVA